METIPLLLKLTAASMLVCLLVLFVAALRRRNRRQMLFCFLMGIIALFLYPSGKEEAEIPLNEQASFIREQMSVAGWYNDYKKILDGLNNNWYQYHKIAAAFTNDEISAQTVRIRMLELYAASQELSQTLDATYIPDNLSDANHNLVLRVLNKTKAYAASQQKIFEQSVYAVDEKNLQLVPGHEEQVNNLKKIMILHNPLTLDIAEDIASLRENLR